MISLVSPILLTIFSCFKNNWNIKILPNVNVLTQWINTCTDNQKISALQIRNLMTSISKPDTVIILIDCWDYDPIHDPPESIQANLRREMCHNIRAFVEAAAPRIHRVYNAQYSGILNPNLDLANWSVPVKFELTLQPIMMNIIEHNIQQVYYMGQHWNNCIRWRATGYRKLLNELQTGQHDVRVLAKQSCTLEHVIINDASSGERFPDFANDAKTTMVPVKGDVWQILGGLPDERIHPFFKKYLSNME